MPRSKATPELERALVLYEAFRQSNDVMFYCDRNGVIQDINDAFTRRYGWTREEVIGQTPRLIRSRHTTNDTYKRMWAQILDPAKGYWRGELINRTKDGRELPVTLMITAVRDAKRDVIGYVSNAVDLSPQLALQSRVAQSEALAHLGEMAAVVAHEIRNPLGSIVMAAKQLAAGRLAKDDRELVLKVLRDESQRLNETLTNFLSYARPRDLKLSPSDVNALVGEVFKLVDSTRPLTRAMGSKLPLDERLEPFPIDSDQVRQVVWNIGLNAVQALDGRGTLNVETGRSDGTCFIRVADTGPGIPESALADIFKPFHTTKTQGTGLGLAVADRIVKAHGGRIEVDSTVGEGTSFTVFLPAIQG